MVEDRRPQRLRSCGGDQCLYCIITLLVASEGINQGAKRAYATRLDDASALTMHYNCKNCGTVNAEIFRHDVLSGSRYNQ
jgi:hypothetical protein